jgi:hypothetical protein
MISSENNMVMALPFAPVRISKSATILLNETVERIFPLFGPFREREWAEGWDPELLYGDHEVKERTVFRTGGLHPEEKFYQWVISKYMPQQFLIEYTVYATERIWFITVECKRHEACTLATITYTYVGWSREAHERNVLAIQNMFRQNLNDWEEAINYYIGTGKKLVTTI